MDRFTLSYNGYNISEVNEFVDEMSENYQNLLDKIKEKDKEIASLKSRLNSKDVKTTPLISDNSFNTNEESLKIIDEAKKNASRIINDALLEAEKLENKKEMLRQELIVLKRKARATLQVQLQSLDDLDDIL